MEVSAPVSVPVSGAQPAKLTPFRHRTSSQLEAESSKSSSNRGVAVVASLTAVKLWRRSQRVHSGRSRGTQGVACRSAAKVATLGEVAQASPAPAEKPRALQLVQIDLEKNKVVLNEKDLMILEKSLNDTGVEKVAIIGVMGAFRTGKSFLLDLMLRYLREKHPPKGYKTDMREECEVPEWVQERKVPDWAVNCGPNLLEGREGSSQDREGFVWRPGMEKCTEGIWFWSEVFVCRAGDEDVAVILMDTQGAWDARMSKEQSATIFGLTTLLASRLIYNVSKQIQQDKIDNLLYFTDFAKAALRAMERDTGVKSEPFQTLEFLVRDWPHFEENCSFGNARSMMESHLDQYFNPQKSQDTKSIDALRELFHDIDVWCLPHPSLKIENESWDGSLAVIEKPFWRFIDSYLEKVFAPAELQAKQNLGNAITVSTFGTVLREFSAAFSDAAPQAKTFSEAMEASTGLLAKDVAIKKAKQILTEKSLNSPSAITDKEFEEVAALATQMAETEFSNKAIFGTTEGIQARKELLLREVEQEIARARDDNERKLEASLTGLTNFSIVGLGAFVVDRVSDVTCDWWSDFCREASTDLSYVYVAVLAWVGFNLYQISEKQGQLNATAAALELAKTVVRQLDRSIKGVQKATGSKNGEVVDVEKDKKQ